LKGGNIKLSERLSFDEKWKRAFDSHENPPNGLSDSEWYAQIAGEHIDELEATLAAVREWAESNVNRKPDGDSEWAAREILAILDGDRR
jgi:hypothetical protein